MTDKIVRQLRIAFIFSLVFSVAIFIADTLYVSQNVSVENPAWERWGIIITLAGIFGALKLLHPRLNSTERENKQDALRRYAVKYYIRLFAIVVIYVFNLVSLHLTGSKNFIFLGIITIFALLFCVPNKENIERETEIREKDI